MAIENFRFSGVNSATPEIDSQASTIADFLKDGNPEIITQDLGSVDEDTRFAALHPISKSEETQLVPPVSESVLSEFEAGLDPMNVGEVLEIVSVGVVNKLQRARGGLRFQSPQAVTSPRRTRLLALGHLILFS